MLGPSANGNVLPVEENQKQFIAWHRVKDHHVAYYQRLVDNLLRSAKIPEAAYCLDLHCSDLEHRDQINKWWQQMFAKV